MEAVFLVTRPGAIAILADCLVAAIAFLVILLFVVVRMATGTVRLKRCVLPEDQPCTRQMTVRTRLVAAVIEWFVSQSGVPEIHLCPIIAVVADVAFLSRDEMASVLSSRRNAVVTRRTGTQYLVVINGNYRRPGRSGVTIFANTRRLYVLGIFACRRDAVVATDAITYDTGMIEVRRCPGDRCVAVVAVVAACNMGLMFSGCRNAVVANGTAAQHLCVIDSHYRRPNCRAMTILADVRCLYMRRVLARRIRGVVTGHAIACDIDVIEICGQPCGGGMAIVAVITARDMHRVFSGRSNAIMTSAAVAQYLSMVDSGHRPPDRCAVAVLADVRRLNVRRVFAGCVRAVMAGHTVAGDICVIEIGRHPGHGRVAVIAVIACRDMGRALARGGHAIVTGSAASQHVCMVDRKYGFPDRRTMAIFTNIRCLNVGQALACGIAAVVASDAIADVICVVEYRRHPGSSVVTIVALIAGHDMSRCFSGCLNAVVARSATAGHRSVIHKRHDTPRSSYVTVRTIS